MGKFSRMLVSLLLVSMLITPIYAADISQIPDNTIRIGNDFYDFTSSNFTNENILKSLDGNNIAYVKLGGYWYDIFLLTSSQINNPSYAETEQDLSSWTGMGTWYKQGSGVEDVVDSDSTGVSGSYVIADNNSFTQKFSVTLSGEAQDFKYYNLFNGDVPLSNSNVPIGEAVTNVSTAFEDISKLKVEFYSDADGKNKVATATLKANGSLTITTGGQDSQEFEVISID